jgi:CHAD domain-containing protein
MYVVQDGVSPEALTQSLQALLPTRHHPIARHRFTLLDTFDGRVRQAGARLMLRGANGTSTLTWRPGGGGTHVAVRVTQPVGFVWELPDGPLRQALARVIGVRRLFAAADAEEYGSLLEILNGEGKTVARLWTESVRARLPMSRNAWQRLPTVITFIGLRGYEDVYQRLVPLVESRPGVESCPQSLPDLMLRQIGASEWDDSVLPRDLPANARADVAARQIHLALLSILRANEPGLRASLDTEFLHDFRVAVRRTRSLLGQIRYVFPPDVVEHFSTEFSWMGRLTGPPRDIDVLVLALREHRGGVSAGDLEVLTALLGEIQKKEHDGLVKALDSDRYRQLLVQWKAFLERPAPPEPGPRNAGRPFAEVISRRALRLSRRIFDGAKAIDERADAEQLHDLRIDAKKLRYLIDVVPARHESNDLERILNALKKLQRVLGNFNDARVQEARLLECGRALAAAGGPKSALLAVRRLAMQSRQRRGHLREQVFDGLARFCALDMQEVCRRVFKKESTVEGAR